MERRADTTSELFDKSLYLLTNKTNMEIVEDTSS